MTKAGGAALIERHTETVQIEQPTSFAERLERRMTGREKLPTVVNALSQIGALCRIRKGVTDFHREVAKKYKAEYERRWGGLKAANTMREPVDTSVNVAFFGVEMAEMIDANRRAGMDREVEGEDLLIAVILMEASLGNLISPALTGRARNRAIDDKRKQLLAALEAKGREMGLSG